uniref:Uncharacterized protein n=1 Tax=Knipowitschia caucasica TaxID=637954 RepID=A0AAV2LXG1_KNICA
MTVTIRNVNLGDSGRYTCRLERVPRLWVFGEYSVDILVNSKPMDVKSTLEPPASYEYFHLFTLLLIPAIIAAVFFLRFYRKKSNKDGELAGGASGPGAGISMYQNTPRPESTDQTYQKLCSST